MKNLKRTTLALSVLMALLCAGCDIKEQPQKTKYTIWVGSAAVAVGYNVNAYRIEDGMYIIDTSGLTTRIPAANVFKIEERK